MKKFMRIALVFALAGATLVGCTKDYSGDISDLNKKVAEQQSAVTALQNAVSNAQTAADNALANAQNALKEAQAAAKAAADANNDEEVAALTAKVATIEGEIAGLEAKVKALDGLEAKLNEVAEQLKKDVDAKVDAALEEIQAELEKAVAQVEGNFSVDGIEAQTATYASAKWAPETSKAGQARLAKLAKVFPELADLKKDDVVETFGHLNFIVNPSSVALDETYTFALVGADGKDSRVVLGNPTPGFNVNGVETPDVRAGLNVWNVEVQSPAYDEEGEVVDSVATLALVVENAAGVYAQTAFEYTILGNDNGGAVSFEAIQNPTFEFDESKSDHSFDAFGKLFNKTGAIYKYIIETDEASVEDFGIKIEGSKISLAEYPTTKLADPIFTITAVSVNGKTVAATSDTLKISHKVPVAPNAELKAQTVTLGYKDGSYNVAVKYDVADFDFSASEWRAVYTALKNTTTTVTATYKNAENQEITYDGKPVKFFGKDGKEYTGSDYSSVAAFGFYVASDNLSIVPDKNYNVLINAGDVFCGKGELTFVNPEACPLKLAEALCDAEGVLQVVGSIDTVSVKDFVKYDLTQALVKSTGYIKTNPNFTFADEDVVYDEDSSWVNGTYFRIPVQGGTWENGTAKQNLLYTPRNFSVKFEWFGNSNNTGKFEFKAEAVSPIYDEAGKGANITINTKDEDGEEAVHTTIYSQPGTGEHQTANLSEATFKIKYVAGTKKGQTVNVTKATSTTGTTFGWHNPEKESDCLPNFASPVTATPDSIAHTNVNGHTIFVVGNNNKLVEVSLDKALELNFIDTDKYINYSADPEKFTYYLTKQDWTDLLDVWDDFWIPTNKYDGTYIAVGADLTPDGTGYYIHDETLVKAAIEDMNDRIEELRESTDEDDKLTAAQHDYFDTIYSSVKCAKYAMNECAISAKKSDPTATPAGPEEIQGYPYFTCANATEYSQYVTFSPSGSAHITGVTAKTNAAGKSTVEIPLTLNVVDKWGMTTKKEFKITVKVKD